jgi:hypothetical protein
VLHSAGKVKKADFRSVFRLASFLGLAPIAISFLAISPLSPNSTSQGLQSKGRNAGSQSGLVCYFTIFWISCRKSLFSVNEEGALSSQVKAIVVRVVLICSK